MIGSSNGLITGVQLQSTVCLLLCRFIRVKYMYSSLCTNHISGNCNCYDLIKECLEFVDFHSTRKSKKPWLCLLLGQESYAQKPGLDHACHAFPGQP